MSTVFRSAIFWSASAFFLFNPLSALAQNVPSIYVTDLTLAPPSASRGETVSGNFSVWNTEERFVSGIVYRIVLREGLTVLDESSVLGEISLSSGERKTFSFSYSLPSNIRSGSYDLRIYLTTKDGLPVGWRDGNVSVSGNERSLLLSEAKIVEGGKEYHPTAGFGFETNQKIFLRFTAANPSPLAISATPKVKVYERDTSGRVISTQSKEGVSFSRGESKVLEYSPPLPSVPESYLAEIRFYDSSEEPVSNALFFRFVIKGLGAEIHTVDLDKDSYSEGETAEAEVSFSGPADAKTVGGPSDLLLELWNEKNELCGQIQKEISLEGGKASVEVPLSCNIFSPKVKAKISKDGDVLDDYEAEGPALEPEPSLGLLPRRWVWVLLSALGAVLAGLFGFFIWKRKKVGKSIFMLFLFGLGFLALSKPAFAADVVYKQACTENHIGITWNSPMEDEEFSPGDTITFSGQVYIPVCINALLDNHIRFYLTSEPPQDCVFRKECHESEESGLIKEGILKAGTWRQLGEIYDEGKAVIGPLEYEVELTIPTDLPPELTGSVYAMVHFDGKHWGDVNSHYNIIAKERIRIIAEGLMGYVWNDADGDGVQDADEDKTDKAEVRLDDPNTGQILDPLGFTVAVGGGAHQVYIKPNECFCPNESFHDLRWNRNENPSTGGPCQDDPWGGVCSYGWDGFNEVAYADMGEFESGDIKYAYLGIQEADFSVPGTVSLSMNPSETVERELTITASECWPSGKEVRLSLQNVPAGLSVSLSRDRFDPSDDGSFVLEVTTDSTPISSYSFEIQVSGESSGGCGADKIITVNINVEAYPWFQTEAGDVYARDNITSRIPAETAAAPFQDDLRFSDLVPSPNDHFSFFSMANLSPGLALSGGVFEWEDGLASMEEWELESYDIGFYDPDEGYDYDYGYFDANLEPSCTLYGSTRMTDGGLAGEDATGTPTNCFVDSHEVIEVNGDLEVQDAVGFDGEKATILVDGNIIFKSDFDPTGFYAFITSRNIEISSVVESIRAFLLADGAIYDYDVGVDDEDDWEDQENGLLISGSAVALDSLDLRRTRKGADGQPDTADDDLEAANYFAFDGELFLELEAILGTPRYTWREVE